MAEEVKDQSSAAQAPKVEQSAQNVPLGGQPIHPVVPPVRAIVDSNTDAKLAATLWDGIIAKLEEGLATVGRDSRTVPASQVRNHFSVWLSEARDARNSLS